MTPAEIDKIVARNWSVFQKPHVLSVRPGWKVVGGWPTNKRAIVVTVDQKLADLGADAKLPDNVEGVAVDVQEADRFRLLRHQNPSLYAAVASQARQEHELPTFPFERDVANAEAVAQAAPALEAARKPAKQKLPYTPADVPLAAITDKFKITLHASPDAGWPTLNPFLQGVQSSLTVGMYDFTSAHILDTVEAALAGKNLGMVLDHPPRNPSADQSDEDTRNALDQALGAKFKFAWALEGKDPMVSSYIFANAYHIKVAVRDGKVFWLSSGNWNNSNQPDVDPISDPGGAAGQMTKSDRDWHAVVEHEGLAKVFEAYLNQDYSDASAAAGGAVALAELALGPMAVLAAPSEIELAARVPTRYFPPLTLDEQMTIQPVLTPDNYAPLILDLILSAGQKFYMQTQYLHPSDKSGDEPFAALVEAVRRKAADGVDVRLIFSDYMNADWLSKLKDVGIDLSYVKTQNRVHNKGMIVDSKIVALGSHNWSADGTLRNRDATLIIKNEAAAKYFEEIFLHDWTRMASQSTA